MPRLDVRHEGDPVVFSLDGETLERTDLALRARPGTMRFCVGDGYDPAPVEWGKSKGN